MDKKESTVVLFPQLSVRYTDEGFIALRERRFEDALKNFEMLRQYGAQTEQSELASVICLLELKEIKEAKERCEELLETGEFLFQDILETYITILVQTNDYEGIIETVQSVLQTKEITVEQKEKLAQLALFAKGMLESEEAVVEIDDSLSFDEPAFADALLTGDYGEQLRAVNRLATKHVEKALPTLRTFLLDETKHPYIKTSILYILMDFGIQEKVDIEKFGETITIIPANLAYNQYDTEKVLHILSERLEHDNPSMYGAIITYWKEMQTSLFPFPLLTDKAELWAAVLERVGRKRFGMPIHEEELLREYGITLEEYHIAYQWFLRIEKEGFMPV
ncbi:hypothetical protein [Bacillus multifaciens]|uniref:hypothetical protein n=1 Tax=Bacillus multifaciens TaxID=3068506 RepID=UPI0027425188|nr:hypothetical protein [Bacillus sp. WLY-B-L8]MDP7977410.1 hypothetical protein [Bacillus sp. WLY-B-L8]HDX9589018.1 hypothetical protein [Bacillus pseudomycoides]